MVGGQVELSPSSLGATTAYFRISSYSSLSSADTELPRLSERSSGDELAEEESAPATARLSAMFSFRNLKFQIS